MVIKASIGIVAREKMLVKRVSMPKSTTDRLRPKKALNRKFEIFESMFANIKSVPLVRSALSSIVTNNFLNFLKKLTGEREGILILNGAFCICIPNNEA